MCGSGVLTALAWLVPHETAAVSAQILCTPYNHAPCCFMQSHIRKVYACSAATCPLHFWQNDRGLLRATAVIRGWTGCRNKSKHRKLTLEKKFLPPLLQGFEPTTFWSRVRCSYHWAFQAPRLWVLVFLSFISSSSSLDSLRWNKSDWFQSSYCIVYRCFDLILLYIYISSFCCCWLIVWCCRKIWRRWHLKKQYFVCLLLTGVSRGQLRDSSEWLQAYRL